jgi:cell fate (sporulation/competence/biofilm development) regulator YmcA (YheA/YmcA/DUF963 family)
LIKEDKRVLRYQQLESLVDQNEKLSNMYSELIELQKNMVQAKHNKTKDYQQKKALYDQQLVKIQEFPLLNEFLSLQNEINEEIIMIVKIVESEINKDFDY